MTLRSSGPTIAWAAAGSGRVDKSGEAERESVRLLGLANEHAPAALIHLAEAARIRGDWTTAARYATASEAAASDRRDSAIKAEAADLGIQLRAKAAAPTEVEAPADLQSLARELRARLRQV